MHIHIDPLGGIAGDMFIAACLDGWPELADATFAAMRAGGLPDSITTGVRPHSDGCLTGTRLIIELGDTTSASSGAYGAIRQRIAASPLADGVAKRALDILRLLGEAEATVHGVPVEDVHFHELAGWDSIADVIGAACLMELLDIRSCSTAPLPLGGGRVMTAHGPLPVPAPATARLLEGLPVIDDGVGGERVTPTGAAIIRHLQPRTEAAHIPCRAGRTGIGFGTRKLSGISNIVRVMELEPLIRAETGGDVAVIAFEIDDQTGEDLAAGLDALRQRGDVLDICQFPAFGKKGRLAVQVQVLCRPGNVDAVAGACCLATTTIGLRWHLARRIELPRQLLDVADLGAVKVVTRPGGQPTVKAELEDLRGDGSDAAGREARRRRIEAAALRQLEQDEHVDET